jgi:hypothetical protein
MEPDYELVGGNVKPRLTLKTSFQPALAVDMGKTFILQVTLCRVAGIVSPHGTLNVDGVGAVSFDKVGIVAVDKAQQFDNRLLRYRVQLPAESGRPADDLAGQVFKFRCPRWEQRLHMCWFMIHFADVLAGYLSLITV